MLHKNAIARIIRPIMATNPTEIALFLPARG